MNPILIFAMMAGGFTGVLTLSLLGGGLIAPAAPGSIVAEVLMTPKGSYFANILAIFLGGCVSFALSAVFLKFFGKDDADIEAARAKTKAAKAESKGLAAEDVKGAGEAAGTAQEGQEAEAPLPGEEAAGSAGGPETVPVPPDASEGIAVVKKIVFACDAGMGSSAMGATKLRKKIQKAGIEDVSVSHSPVSEVPADADLIVCHSELSERAKAANPRAKLVPITDFLGAPEYEDIVELLKKEKEQRS
jgi:PTS system mannitol-specific IIC component